MPRHPSTIAQLHGPDFVGATPPDMAAQEARVRHTLDDADQQIRALAHRIGYQLPADCTDPDLIQRDISANMRRSVDVCLELGRGLLVLKAASPHGTFIARLEVLGIDRKVAAKFMQAADKFSNVSAPRHNLSKALNSQSQLLELLVLDDDQLDELALTGETGETGAISLDRIECMSTRELRAALREERADKEAQARLLTDKGARLDELDISLRKAQRLTAAAEPDAVLMALQQDISVAAIQCEAILCGPVTTALDALAKHCEIWGRFPALHGALLQIESSISHVLGQVAHLRDKHGIQEVDKDLRPAWLLPSASAE